MKQQTNNFLGNLRDDQNDEDYFEVSPRRRKRDKECSRMNIDSSIRLVSLCTRELVGLKSHTTSPTENWILRFQDAEQDGDGEAMYDGARIDSAFVKSWVNFTKVSKSRSELYCDTARLERALALNLEADIYRYKIRPILDHKVCPNFVKFLFYDHAVSFQELAMFAAKSNIPKHNLERNIVRIYHQNDTDVSLPVSQSTNKMLKTRNQMKRSRVDRYSESVIPSLLTYNVLVNESMEGSEDFFDWTRRVYTLKNKPVDSIFWNTVLQVAFACQAMANIGMCHNDLHLCNVYVTEEKQRSRLHIVEDKYYALLAEETPTITKVFDFDRSYVSGSSDNALIEGDLCDEFNSCNTFSPNKDIIHFLSYLYLDFRNHYLTDYEGDAHVELGKLLFYDENRVIWENMNDDEVRNLRRGGGEEERLTDNDFEVLFYPIESITAHLAILAGVETGLVADEQFIEVLGTIQPEDVFVSKAGLFKGSKIDMELMARERREIEMRRR